AELASGLPSADILWSSAMDLQMGLVLEGKALACANPEARALSAGAVYRDLAYATTLEPLLTLVNRDCFDVSVAAGSLDEIAAAISRDPAKFYGRIASYDIERNGLGFLALLLETRRSADFGACLQTLARCKPKIFGSNPPLVEEVASGRAALAYHVLGSYALRAVAAYPSLAVAASNTPALAVSRVAFVSSRAPHPRAAQFFLDYLLSRDGQQQLLKAGLFPIRTDAGATPSGNVNLSLLRIDQGGGELLDAGQRRELLELWRAAIGGPDASS
ncbi:MAG: hypothetical protein AAB325_06415, partial [Pseudomonadota bacterium]